MKQDINFLKLLPKISNPLSANKIGLISICLLVFLMVISGGIGLYGHSENKKLDQSTQDLNKAQAAYDKIIALFPMFASDKPLVQQITELKRSIQDKEDHLEAISHQTLRQPFSPYLQKLSQAIPTDLWLNNIYIDQDSGNISISGFGLQSIDVSNFLRELRQEAPFKGTEFDLFYVKKVPGKNYVQFEISNNQLLTLDEGAKK